MPGVVHPEILAACAVSLVAARCDADEAGVLAGDGRDEDVVVGGAPMNGTARRERG
ncbi:UNVERIFIED_CONTAM: hypothetical protein OHV15_02230 [Microbacterium sp. SLM126]